MGAPVDEAVARTQRAAILGAASSTVVMAPASASPCWPSGNMASALVSTARHFEARLHDQKAASPMTSNQTSSSTSPSHRAATPAQSTRLPVHFGFRSLAPSDQRPAHLSAGPPPTCAIPCLPAPPSRLRSWPARPNDPPAGLSRPGSAGQVAGRLLGCPPAAAGLPIAELHNLAALRPYRHAVWPGPPSESCEPRETPAETKTPVRFSWEVMGRYGSPV